MLRHYDAIGLLRPAQVDPPSGYRLYRAAQLSRLNRIIALKDCSTPLGSPRLNPAEHPDEWVAELQAPVIPA